MFLPPRCHSHRLLNAARLEIHTRAALQNTSSDDTYSAPSREAYGAGIAPCYAAAAERA
jgi:hypothetical protein